MRRTEKAELIAIVLSVFMAGGMIAVALMTNSIAILAEGTDTVMDVVASIAVLVGLRLSMRKTRTFPSGLYKLENLIATGIGVLILLSAYELGREAIERLVSGGTELDDPWLILAVMAVVVVLTAFIAWYKGMVGKQENSPSLQADARHSWTDMVASVAIIVGIGLEMVGVNHMDSIAALVVVGFLAWSGVEVTLGGVKVLLDASIDKDVLEKAGEIASAHPLVRHVLGVVGRNSGSYRFLELSLVPEQFDLRDAEQISSELKASIREEIENVDEVVFDFSVESGRSILGAAAISPEGELFTGHLAEAPFFSLLEIETAGGSATFREQLANPVGREESGRGARVAVFLARHGVGALAAVEPDLEDGAFHVLDANGVAVLPLRMSADIDEAEKTLADFARANKYS